MGKSEAAGRGLKQFMSPDYRNSFMERQEAIVKEFMAHGSEEDKANLEYVLHGRACDPDSLPPHVKTQIATGKYHGGELKEGEFDEGHAGMTLPDFVSHETSKTAALDIEEVLALRLYTTSSFPCFNSYFRSVELGEGRDVPPHPFHMSVFHLDQGLKKLRTIGAKDPEKFNAIEYFYRGMKDMELDFLQFRKCGGTELAPMSTTSSLAVAKSYAKSTSPLLFKFKTQGLSRGCSIEFLSVYPKEK
eukprot:177830-Rhodomonas_salina.3